MIFSVFPILGQAGELHGNFSFTSGLLLTDDDFSKAFDLDKRVEAGVTCDAKKENWPVSIVAAYFLSYGNSDKSDISHELSERRDTHIYCSETYIGIKKIFEDHPFVKPFLAGGLYSISMYADISYDSEYDGAIGCWYSAGACFAISEYWHLDLEWKRSRANMDLFDRHLDAGGEHVCFSVGYHFPR